MSKHPYSQPTSWSLGSTHASQKGEGHPSLSTVKHCWQQRCSAEGERAFRDRWAGESHPGHWRQQASLPPDPSGLPSCCFPSCLSYKPQLLLSLSQPAPLILHPSTQPDQSCPRRQTRPSATLQGISRASNLGGREGKAPGPLCVHQPASLRSGGIPLPLCLRRADVHERKKMFTGKCAQ